MILPVYNTERYLRQCLDSLVGQTLDELEVVAVDNGSTDTSLDILREYEARYPKRVVVRHLDAADVSLARNEGIAAAQGEYIGFVDSDDYVDCTMFEKLYAKANGDGVFDVAVCDMIAFFEDSERTEILPSNILSNLTTGEEIRQAFVDSYAVITNKIFKRKLFESGVRFTPKVWSEDIEFLYRIFPEISNMAVVYEPLYYYRQRMGSLTHIYSERLYDYVSNFDAIIEDFQARGHYEAFRQELEYQYVRYVYATMIKRLAKSEDWAVFKKGVRFAQGSVKKRFPHYRKNALFYQKGLKGWYLVFFSLPLAFVVYAKERKRKI